jgi:hypothetical protein
VFPIYADYAKKIIAIADSLFRQKIGMRFVMDMNSIWKHLLPPPCNIKNMAKCWCWRGGHYHTDDPTCTARDKINMMKSGGNLQWILMV